MIRAIIVDDERHAREMLAMKLQTYCANVQTLALADSATSALRAINEQTPDVLFLDIEMPGDGGFDLLSALGAFDFSVIFVTAFERHAVRAIKHSALDYLLKPVSPLELQAAVAKAARVLENERHTRQPVHTSLDISAPKSTDRLALPTGHGFEFVRIADIVRCRADSNYTQLYLLDGSTLLVSRTLAEFESLLTPHNFYRIHVSHLINMRYVKRYHKGRGGTVEMTDGVHVQVSARRRDLFLEHIAGV